jgi:hypothetical protein
MGGRFKDRTPGPSEASPQARGGRKGGRSRSAAKLAAARANGAKGGRPTVPLDLFPPRLRSLPRDLLERAARAQEIAHWLVLQALEGKGSESQHERVHRALNVILRAIPKERLLRAENVIRGAAAPTKAHKQRSGAKMTERRGRRRAIRG